MVTNPTKMAIENHCKIATSGFLHDGKEISDIVRKIACDHMTVHKSG
jgi:hypothetical protein